ncbi:distal tail protein Dit [Halobacillus aidingensis]|uniref:Putative phage tail component, N-terminal domain-containing protein n=1 Tax=Halobacillus aidingensis TaxID=240303 RepID=A0A1H0MF80_HALAD|nr:distal tail protein Dit [Halobacillus aidingensis]SDO79122.1 putative phage tail component, N-terminal domain-containing protein [Halobacillus aidingensis]
MNLTFNSTRKPWIHLLEGRSKPPFAPINRTTIDIPGTDGSFLQSTRRGPLLIQQPVGFKVLDDAHALQIKDELADWLFTEEKAVLQFDDEPGRYYYAVVTNTIEDLTRFVDKRSGTIQFLCLDPNGYGADVPPQSLGSHTTLFNEGTAEAYPVFEIDVIQSITRLEITNLSLENQAGGSPSIILGRNKARTETAFQKEELVFHDTMTSTSSWTTAQEVDNGYISGEMGADSDGFYAELVGEEILPHKWQGPSLIKGIGQSLQDFRADILIQSPNINFETGLMDVYLRDANGNTMGKVGFGDAWEGQDQNFGFGQVGDYNTGHKVYAFAKYPYGWNDFDGVIRIVREGDIWRWYFAKIENGVHNWVYSTLRYTDNAGQYMAPITDVQVAMRIWPLTSSTDMKIKDIKLYKINQPQGESEVPIMAEAGDKITIDTRTGLIAKNGEPQLTLADVRTQMFPLAPGYNQLVVASNGSVNASVSYTNTYK